MGALALWLAVAAPLAAEDSNPTLDAFRRKAQLRLAEAALEAHNIDRAHERLEQALALAEAAADAPELGRVTELLGDVHLRRNQLRTARSFYLRALESSPGEAVRIQGQLGRVATRRVRRRG